MALLDGPYIINTSRRDVLICWTTDAADSASSEVKIGSSSTSLTQSYRSNVAPTLNGTLNRYLHQVRVSGLSPLARYYYTVGRIGTPIISASNNLSFWTAPTIGDNSSKRRFWVIADGGVGGNTGLLNNFYNFDATYPNGNNRVDGIISIGDNAYGSGSIAEYPLNFFDNWASLLQNTNLLICQGNHDYGQNPTSTMTSKPCWNYFGYSRYTEAGGIAPFNPRFYSWDYGNIHFISLDAYHSSTSDDPSRSVDANSFQMRWLKNEIEFYNKEKLAGRKKWLIVICHFPAFCHDSTSSGHNTFNDVESYGTDFRNRFVPILNQGDVDLVLYGHDHNYYRTWFFHDYIGNSGSLFSNTTNVWPPYVGSYGRGSNAAFPAATGSPYVKTNTYYGAVHIVQGNGNASYYPIVGNYGGLMCCSTGISPTNFLNGNTGQFLGSGIIDIEPGIGTGGRDRLTYYHIRSNGSIVDYFQMDK